MELGPHKLKKKTMGDPVTSLTLKCRNLSLSYQNETIPIPTKNRTPRITG